jgi:hypothetical protein
MGEQEGAKQRVLASHLNTFSINQMFYRRKQELHMSN